VTYPAQHNDLLKRWQLGTEEWLLHSDEFKHWYVTVELDRIAYHLQNVNSGRVETKGVTLFCPGIPGSGKPILTSIVITMLGTRKQARVAHHSVMRQTWATRLW
jgi:hypothetical protein